MTESFDQYKFELQIKQTNNSISGVSYSYRSTVFYGKATLTGTFNETGQSALIREIKTVELRMSGGFNACIMKCIFQYDKSGKEEFLEGTFTSKFEKNGFGVAKGDDCGDGKVRLRKVATSDFYIEPFLRSNIKTKTPAIVNKPPVSKDSLKIKTPANPGVKKPGLTSSKPALKSTETTNPVTKINSPVKQKIDSAQKIISPVVKENPDRQTISAASVLKTRENALIKTLVVNDPDVTVKLYDNGEIDGDTISVYLDKKLVLSAKGLTASPLTLKLKMDEDNPDHELIMVAENLGRIPPNTSLMIVECGEQRFDVRITSTEQKNAVVRFRYQKPKQP